MGKKLTLGTKLNILLGAVFIVGTLVTWFVAARISKRETEVGVAKNAALLLKATAGVRTYTVNNVAKMLLKVQEDQHTFLPETVPAFSARLVFENFRTNGFEEYLYKEASSNPTNVKDDKADAFEEGVLGEFRKKPDLATLSGYREDFGGQRRFYTAQAMRLTDRKCLTCHSTPDVAPPEMVKLYGDKNGFNWQIGDVIAARIVYVPAGHVAVASQRSAGFVTAVFAGLFAVLVGVINLLVRNGVIKPLRVLTLATQAVAQSSVAEGGTKQFLQSDAGRSLEKTKERGDELGQLAGGFATMAGEVEKRETGLREAKAQVAQREAYFRAMIENASVTYLILDTRYLIRYASPLVKPMLGLNPTELEGTMVLHLVPADSQRPLLDAVSRSESKKGTSDPFVFRRVMADGTERFIEAVVTNLLEEPSILGLVMVLRDVTARKRLDELELHRQPDSNPGMVPVPVTVEVLPASLPALEKPADPVLATKRLIDTFPTLEPEQQQAIVVRLVAAGLASGAKAALPVAGVSAIRGKFGVAETEAIDAGRLIELFVMLADFAVALDSLVWSTWKTLAPQSEIRRTNDASTATPHIGLKKLLGSYLGVESTIPRGQVAYDLERSRALTAALIASIGQVGKEFAIRYRAKFEPREVEKRAGMKGGGILGLKDAKCWRSYCDLASEMDEEKIEREVLEGLAQYAESLLKSLRR